MEQIIISWGSCACTLDNIFHVLVVTPSVCCLYTKKSVALPAGYGYNADRDHPVRVSV